MKTCKDCKWWDDCKNTGEVLTDQNCGRCRFNSPVIISSLSLNNSVYDKLPQDKGIWPFTDNDDWCGEFLPKDLKTKLDE